MLNKDIIRENLTSLSFEDKLNLWNDYCINAKIGEQLILENKPSVIKKFAEASSDDIFVFFFTDRFNKEHEYVRLFNGYITTIAKNDASALVDINLRTDFTDKVFNGDSLATQLYHDFFPLKDNTTEEKPTDSDESNKELFPRPTKHNRVNCQYTVKNGVPILDAEVFLDDNSSNKFHFEGDDAIEAQKKLRGNFFGMDEFSSLLFKTFIF